MDDWHTIDTKKKVKNVSDVHIVAQQLKGNIKIIPKMEFDNYKTQYIGVSFALSELFDSINAMVHTSSQYLSSRQINHNQHNHNIYHHNNIDDSDIDLQINSMFNKLSVSNVQIIMESLKSANIVVYNEMIKVVGAIYQKCIANEQLIPLYTKVIKHIIINYSWVVYDDHCKPITFRKILIDHIEYKFNEIIDDIRLNKESKDENISLDRKAFFTMIGAFFDESIFGNQLFRFIFTSLENAFIQTKHFIYMDYWLILSIWANKVWIIENPEYLLEKIEFIKANDHLMNTKIRLLSENLNEVTSTYSKGIVTKEEDKLEKITPTQINTLKMFGGYVIMDLVDNIDEYSSKEEWYIDLCEIEQKCNGIINKVITTLCTKITNLKSVFSILLFLKKQKEYEDLIIESIRAFSSITNCNAYINNAKKMLKK